MRKHNKLAELPDIVVSSKSIFAWNMGRKVIRKVGLVYYKRIQLFLALYALILISTVIYLLVDVLMTVSKGSDYQITPGIFMVSNTHVFSVVTGILEHGRRAASGLKLTDHCNPSLFYRPQFYRLCSTPSRLSSYFFTLSSPAFTRTDK